MSLGGYSRTDLRQTVPSTCSAIAATGAPALVLVLAYLGAGDRFETMPKETWGSPRRVSTLEISRVERRGSHSSILNASKPLFSLPLSPLPPPLPFPPPRPPKVPNPLALVLVPPLPLRKLNCIPLPLLDLPSLFPLRMLIVGLPDPEPGPGEDRPGASGPRLRIPRNAPSSWAMGSIAPPIPRGPPPGPRPSWSLSLGN